MRETNVSVKFVTVPTITGTANRPINAVFQACAIMGDEKDGPRVKVQCVGRSAKTNKPVNLSGEFRIISGESSRGRNGSTELTLRGPKGDYLLDWKKDSITEFEPIDRIPTVTTVRKSAAA